MKSSASTTSTEAEEDSPPPGSTVEEAQMSKPRIARIADLVAGRFSLGIILCALATLIVWWILKDFSTALPYALTVLVVACPCALGLATPAALSCGLGRAANLGVLFKDALALETLSHCDIIFFDKTGTLTEGKPAVSGSPDPDPTIYYNPFATSTRYLP